MNDRHQKKRQRTGE